MKLETILNAAINSMVRGHHEPFCYSAHVPHKGYVNRGDDPETRADYLAQLERSARQEAENMRYAKDYAEPGYEASPKGVLFANWNVFPRGLDSILERAGYSIEWSDEWTECGDCYRAIRTEPNGFCWEPSFKWVSDCEIVCSECAANYEDDEDDETEE